MNKEINRLKQLDDAYTNGTPLVDDLQYDNFRDLVKSKYPNHPYFKTVGSSSMSGRKVTLGYTIGSLNKTNPDTFTTWANKQTESTFVVSEKLDGSGILVIYEGGQLVFAATRGDGSVGMDITNKARIMLPTTIEYTDRLVLRGEAMLCNGDHKKLGYKNPRNGVAGLLNKIGYRDNDVALIKVFFHELIEPRYSKGQMFDIIEKCGFNTPRRRTMSNVEGIERALSALLVEWKQFSQYEIDGLVVSCASAYREDVYYPEHSVAFKVNQSAVRTRVTGIEWNVSRAGRVKPVVLVEPVEIDGTTVSRATGFNAKFVADNNIKEGVIVGLVKSGEIIPHIVYVE